MSTGWDPHYIYNLENHMQWERKKYDLNSHIVETIHSDMGDTLAF